MRAVISLANKYTAIPAPPRGDLERHYASGLTQAEVGELYGTTQKVVYSWFKKLGIQARVAAKRDQRGAKNHMWGGDDVTYAAFHYRVKAVRGAPSLCEQCGTTDPDTRYEWASVTRNYSDPNDYIRLCKRCHVHFDDVPAKSAKTQLERRLPL